MKAFQKMQKWFAGPHRSISETLSTFPPLPTRQSTKRLAKSRKFLVPTMLVLNVIVFVLSFVFVYYMIEPHTDTSVNSATGHSSSASPSANGASLWEGYFRRRDEPFYSLPDQATTPDQTASTLPGSDATNSTGQAPVASTNEPANPSDDVTALVFYSFAVPMVSSVMLGLEVFWFFHAPKLYNLKAVHTMGTAITTLMAVAWIIQNAIWIHCEFVSPSCSMAPNQLHRLDLDTETLKQISIAKIVLTWVLICGLVAHLDLQIMDSRNSRRVWYMSRGGNEFTQDTKSELVSIEEHEFAYQARQGI